MSRGLATSLAGAEARRSRSWPARGAAGAGRGAPCHRKIAVDDDLGARLIRDFARRGWTIHEYVVMPPDDALPPTRLDSDGRDRRGLSRPVWRQGIRAYTPDDETVRQLVEAQLGRRKAVEVRCFAAYGELILVAAYCELFSADGVGQVESVMAPGGVPRPRAREGGHGPRSGGVRRRRPRAHVPRRGPRLAAASHAKLGFREAGRIWDFV